MCVPSYACTWPPVASTDPHAPAWFSLAQHYLPAALVAAPSKAVMVSPEVKLVSAAAGLYSSFLYWGYLQEKITGADYVSPVDPSITGRWHFSFVLNGERAKERRERREGSRHTPHEVSVATPTSLLTSREREGGREKERGRKSYTIWFLVSQR